MYINKIICENVGPIEKFILNLPFSDGKPKPVVLVGENGTGKSTVISNIVDSLYEIARQGYNNAAKQTGFGEYEYYKAISPIEIHVGKKYLYSLIKFCDEYTRNKFHYVFKSGMLNIEDFKKKTGMVSNKISWADDANYKSVTIESKQSQNLLSKDILCYFPPERYEKPIWLGGQYYSVADYEHLSLKPKLSDTLDEPILVNDVSNDTLQWLLDVIVDSRGDISINDKGELYLTHVAPVDIHLLLKARTNIELIMSLIIGEEVYFQLGFRDKHTSRFVIKRKKDNSVVAPSLDSLSTGQSALFNMFTTIVRYADMLNINYSINLPDIHGVVVIDEVELHLHSTLQREILPSLITLFPQVQFIVTTHSPLFLLGMEEKFGRDGFDIYQMPNAAKISAERFSEFQNAYSYFTKTQRYEKDIYNAILGKNKNMLVVTEGSTDWKHMKAAYNKLSSIDKYKDIFKDLDFSFLEYEPANSKTDSKIKLDMGNNYLISMCENFSRIKQERKIVFIADRDDNKTNNKLGNQKNIYKNWGNNVYSLLLPLPKFRNDTPNISIEHLYTDDVIKTKVTCSDGIKRRLYMGLEFDKRGCSTDLKLFCEKRDICGKNNIAIIDGGDKSRVTKLDDADTNIALPKMEFANMILNEKSPFKDVDFTNFVEIFRMLKKIYDE